MTLQLATEHMLAHVDDQGIGWMTFNNPARHNALSLEMWQGMGDALEYFQHNDAVRVVVMRGAGGKASEARTRTAASPRPSCLWGQVRVC